MTPAITNIHQAAFVLNVLDHPMRQKILFYIAEQAAITVTHISKKFRLLPSSASRHLALLRKVKVVSTSKRGKNIYYTVSYLELDRINNLCGSILQSKTK